MNISLLEHCQKRKLLVRFSLSLLILTFLYASVCTPIYLWAVSDILIADTVFPLLWDVVMSLLNYAFYWIAFSQLLYSVFRLGWHHTIPMVFIYSGIVVFRYLANTVANIVMNGWSNDFWNYSFPYVLTDIGLDLAVLAVALIIIYSVTKRLPIDTEKERTQTIGLQFPIIKLFDFHKKLTLIAFLLALVPASVQLISRMIYDISLVGSAQGIADLLWMIVFYVSDLASVFIGYLIMVLLLGQYRQSELKIEKELEATEL